MAKMDHAICVHHVYQNEVLHISNTHCMNTMYTCIKVENSLFKIGLKKIIDWALKLNNAWQPYGEIIYEWFLMTYMLNFANMSQQSFFQVFINFKCYEYDNKFCIHARIYISFYISTNILTETDVLMEIFVLSKSLG